MSSSDNKTIAILETTILYLHQYIIPLFILLGDIGNFLVLFIFWKRSWRRNVCVFYLTINLLINTFYINFVMLADFLTAFEIQPNNYSQIYCKIHTYFIELISILSPTILILASIDRLLISSQNVDTRLYSSKRLAYFLISINIFFWMIYNSHILMRVNIQEIHFNELLCYYDLSSFYLRFATYSTLIINCCLSLTMIILCLFACKNVQQYRSLTRQQIRRMTKKDFQLLRCLFAEDIVYIIFSIGMAIYKVYEATTIHRTRTWKKQVIIDFFEHLNEFLHHIPYCLSFYVYIFISKAFRNEFKRVFYRLHGKDVNTIRDEEIKAENIVRS